MSLSNSNTPRPAPQFFQHQTLSTKKARGTPLDRAPPRPPVKSLPPVSKIFRTKSQPLKAQAVSFRTADNSLLSKHYDDKRQDLYFNQCFEVVSKLGAGSFGEVFKVRSKEDGKMYAVKRSRERFRGESDRRRKLQEVQKHEVLPRHPNCVRFVKAWEEKQHLYIQTELCDTSLSNYSEVNHDIPETLIWNYLVDLLLAVKHLHDHNLVHLDIKPDNIFISHDGICKLGDFGLVLDLTKEEFSDAQEGDPKYLAPELMDGKFGKAADIFSLGITVLELACDLDLPRGGDSWHELRGGLLPPEFVEGLSVNLREILSSMVIPDPAERPTVGQLLAHPSITEVWKWRRWTLIWKTWVSSVRNLYVMVVFAMSCLLTVLGRSFRRSEQVTGVTPRPALDRSHTNHSCWDYSFSDDEVCDDDTRTSSIPHLSLSDSSSSNDSKNGSVLNSFQEIFNLSASVIKNRSLARLVTPKHSPGNEFGSFRVSPRYTSSPQDSHKSTPYTASLHSSKQLDDSDALRLSIGPKNLMEVFDSADSEEDWN